MCVKGGNDTHLKTSRGCAILVTIMQREMEFLVFNSIVCYCCIPGSMSVVVMISPHLLLNGSNCYKTPMAKAKISYKVK